MNCNEYQNRTAFTAIYPEAGTGHVLALAYTALGLAGEAGEIANKVKKILRDSDGVMTPEVQKDLAKETGDAFYYLARFAAEIGYPLSNIAEANLAKLLDRKARGVIGGSGDTR